MGEQAPMYECPVCGMQAELRYLHDDGTPAPPSCGMHGETYPKMVPVGARDA